MNNNKSKLKILMCSEASFLNSGFGTYTKELLSRLHKTNKYIVAEFASYGFVNDSRDKDINWTYYANAVREGDARYSEYSARGDNQFGRWRFEKVLLDFKPDIVIDIRDYWMSAYQAVSPLRKFFHWILMPTVDSEPQQEEWIDTFLSADAIFTYSDWGAKVLSKQSSGHIKYIDTVSPGVDLNTFRIKDRSDIRTKYNIPCDSIIIGSVMRNQKRKLIPELLSSIRKLIDSLIETKPEIASKIFLYLHTSYPDMGWDIPELLKDTRMANRTLFTYLCKNCKNVSSSVYKGVSTTCSKCRNKSCFMPSVTDGITTENLSDIYNLFDIYVQYSICEGFGMPQVEAGACGIPIATVNYSAMCDIIEKLDAYPIGVQSVFKELETKAFRVYPNNDNLIEIISSYIQLPEKIKNEKRIKTRLLTENEYCWDKIAGKWQKYFDALDASGYRADWQRAPIMLNNPTEQKNMVSNFDTLMDLCQNNLKDTNMIGSARLLTMLKHADYGFVHNGPTQIGQYSIKNIYEYINQMITNNNEAEHARMTNIKFDDDFILYAKMKGSDNG